MTKRFTIHTEEDDWETEDGCFSRYRHFLCDKGNVVIELNAHVNDCVDFADSLNKLHEENEDHKELCDIYVDFMVSKGYELADIIEYTHEGTK